VVLGPMVLRIPGSSLRHVKSLPSSGASQGTEYLPFEHSNAVWLRKSTYGLAAKDMDT
jgi:hypothetical protein